ncbi:hypothetical protein BKA65DRAFT_600649 [Rhexocercosporidium sp. MPI-PUGE-AT-0058]|nr:hypothetical protein BKA65DRAFT_600649 [Rhexocercosporidium sp. MPI-PUGE-AT-0058]
MPNRIQPANNPPSYASKPPKEIHDMAITEPLAKFPSLKRINQPTGSFFIPSNTLLIKDFIDTNYQTTSTSHLFGDIPISTILYNTLKTYMQILPSISSYSHLDYASHHTPPTETILPLWRQTSCCGAHLPSWPITKSFLRNFRPLIDAVNAIFHYFQPASYIKMRNYHDALIHNTRVPGLRKPVWDDGYRTPFASMRISVIGNQPVKPGFVRERMLRGGKKRFESQWVVVTFLGGWLGGEALFAPGEGEVVEQVEVEAGDAWVLRGVGGGSGGGKGCVFGLKGGNVVGERVMVDLFVPAEGWLGVEDEEEEMGA